MESPGSSERLFNRFFSSIRASGGVYLLSWLLLLPFLGACANTPVREAEPISAPAVSEVPLEPVQAEIDPYKALPELASLEKSLDKVGDEYGLHFYRNQKGLPFAYSARNRETFTIADQTGNCLYEIRVLPPDDRRRRPGDDPDIPILDVVPGPCGLSFPDLDSSVKKGVASMETEIVYPALLSRLEGTVPLPHCSPADLIQDVLPIPYKIQTTDDGLEPWLWKHAEPVVDPFDLSFGDVIAFDLPDRDTKIGIYTGHGLVVCFDTCEKASIHRMEETLTYRAYRLFAGFAWSRHALKEAELLKRYISGAHEQRPSP